MNIGKGVDMRVVITAYVKWFTQGINRGVHEPKQGNVEINCIFIGNIRRVVSPSEHVFMRRVYRPLRVKVVGEQI